MGNFLQVRHFSSGRYGWRVPVYSLPLWRLWKLFPLTDGIKIWPTEKQSVGHMTLLVNGRSCSAHLHAPTESLLWCPMEVLLQSLQVSWWQILQFFRIAAGSGVFRCLYYSSHSPSTGTWCIFNVVFLRNWPYRILFHLLTHGSRSQWVTLNIRRIFLCICKQGQRTEPIAMSPLLGNYSSVVTLICDYCTHL